MNPRIFLRIHPQENRENVEKSEFSRVRNETFRENLTSFILKINRRNGAVTGLKPDRKRGQRKSVPFVYGGKVNHEQIPSSEHCTPIPVPTQSCMVVNERVDMPNYEESGRGLS
jgi:hypothetical protein